MGDIADLQEPALIRNRYDADVVALLGRSQVAAHLALHPGRYPRHSGGGPGPHSEDCTDVLQSRVWPAALTA